MPETTYLHIQSHDPSPARVLEIPWGSVRIGRGEQCEVRLGEPALAEVQCMLRRSADAWQIQPVGPPGRISIAGRAVEQTRPLPVGTAFRVGEHWLTLRPAEAPAVETWGTVTPPEPAPASASPDAEPPREPLADAAEGDRHRGWQDRLEQRERWLKTRLDERRWEARWKAAGAGIAARSAAARPSNPPRSPGRRPHSPAAHLADVRPVDASLLNAVPATEAPPVARVVGLSRPIPTRATPAPDAPPAPAAEVAPVVEILPAEGPSGRPAAPEPLSRSLRVTGATRRRDPESAASPVRNPGLEDSTPATSIEAAAAPLDAAPGALALVGTPAASAAAPAEPTAESPLPTRPRRRGRRATLGVATTVPPVEELAPEPAPFPGLPNLDLAGLLQLMMAGATAPPVESAASFVGVAGGVPPEPVAMAGSELLVTDPEVLDLARPALGLPAPTAEVAAAAGPERAEEPESAAGPGTFGVSAPGGMLEWPSARVILQQHRVHRPQPAPAPKAGRVKKKGEARPAAAGPTPTLGREPGHWTIPALGWLWAPAVAAVAAVGVAGSGLAWAWAKDDQAAGSAADRLFDRPAPLTAEEAEHLLAAMGPDASWWKTTAGHLLLRAALADRAGAAGQGQVPGLLHAAQGAAPAHGAVRLARARKATAGADAVSPAENLGLPRDVVALAWTGRKLAEAGRVEPALKAYRAALEMASRAGSARPGSAKFLADGRSNRFALPGEDAMEPIVREMAGLAGWSYDRWSAGLPGGGVARLVAARVLRESGSPDAEKALAAAAADPGCSAIGLAARAEALAMLERLEEAEADYRKAIAAMPEDRVRRAWSLNLAEVCGRLNDDAKRRAAWEAARSAAPGDEVTRRVADAQDRAGVAVGDRPSAATRRL